MAVAEGAEPISLAEEQKQRSNPWLDAWRLFRRNKASLVALVMISMRDWNMTILSRCYKKKY